MTQGGKSELSTAELERFMTEHPGAIVGLHGDCVNGSGGDLWVLSWRERYGANRGLIVRTSEFNIYQNAYRSACEVLEQARRARQRKPVRIIPKPQLRSRIA